jgi:hypothetical protein
VRGSNNQSHQHILTLPPTSACLSSLGSGHSWVGVCPRVVARESALRSSSTPCGHDGWWLSLTVRDYLRQSSWESWDYAVSN